MIELKLTPEQLTALGLDGAEEVTQERFATALDAILAKASGGEEHGQQIQTLTAERDAAIAKLKEIEDAQSMAEVDALLADYDLPEESAAAMRDLAKTNRDQAKALLGGMKKKEVGGQKTEVGEEKKPEESGERKPEAGEGEKKEKEPLPKPVHDPKAMQTEATGEAERNKAVAEYRKSHPGATFQQAWQYLQRTQPELFKGMEKAA